MLLRVLLPLLPFLRWRDRVGPDTLRADLLAGLTGAVVVLPQGVAFATIAGMPPEYGLYAAMVPAVVAALYGSSMHLVSGPTTAASIVLFSTLGALAEPGTAQYVSLALTLTLMVGVIELAMGMARMGFLVNFISHSVVIGFTAGAAILIATHQIKNFLGLDIPRGLHFHEVLMAVHDQVDAVNPYVASVGVVTLLSGIVVKRWFPRVPYMIAAMLAGSAAAVILDAVLGRAVTQIATVGALPATLPPLSRPDLSLSTIKDLAPAALAVTLFALTEAVSISRALAARSGQLINGNQEFIGQGLSNLVGSFFSSYVATGSFNRSGVNYEAGARTPLAAVFAGLMLMAVVLLVAPLAAYLPDAAMAGILFLVAWGLIDFQHMRKTTLTSRADSLVMWVTFGATLFLELEFAILLGVFLSLVAYLSRTSRPRVMVRMPDPRLPKRRFNTDSSLPECPQLKIVRIDGSLFFGAVAYVAERLRVIGKHNRQQSSMLILARSINFVDVAGAELLAREAADRRRRGGRLYVVHAKEAVREPLVRGGYMDGLGEENFFESKTEAIAGIFAHMDKDICARCDKRIFHECAAVPRVGREPPTRPDRYLM